MAYSTPGFPVQSLLKLMSIESMMPSSHLILCHPLFMPSIFPKSGSFPMSYLFSSGGQSIRVSESVFPMNIQDWFPLDWLVWSPCCPRDSKESFPTLQFEKHQFFSVQPTLWSNSHICTWLLEKNIALSRWTFVSKVMCLLFNTLS